MTAGNGSTADRWLAILVLSATWACYLPVGAKYATVLPAAICAAVVAWRRRDQFPVSQWPGLLPGAVLLSLLALSAAWSPAPWTAIASHLGLYALVLVVPLIGTTCPAATARVALQHFVVAAAGVGLLVAAATLDLLPASPLWRSTIDAQGNQRIANSILLALATVLALHFGWHAGGAARLRWLLAASACALGLALQDRRSGMLLLPLLLMSWAVFGQRKGWQRLALVAAIVVSALVIGHSADGVRGRFAEGLAELKRYVPDDHVSTSWGQRLRMWELTGAMVAERPLLGHGAASWEGLWRHRVVANTPLAANSTPHNEYLLILQQAGVLGGAAWLWLLLSNARQAVTGGPAGLPMLMVWLTIAWTGVFNVVLRDARFSLPLLLLAALALAATRLPMIASPRPTA